MHILLHALRYYDIIENTKSRKERYSLLCQSLQRNQNSLSTKVSSFGGIRKRWIGLHAITTGQMPAMSSEAYAHFTLKFGRMLMALFQRVLTFTIKTSTRLTMLSRIWNVSQKKNTRNVMNSTKSPHEESSYENKSCQRLKRLQRYGTLQKRVERGIALLEHQHGKLRNTKHMHVSSAERNFSHALCSMIMPASALMAASQRGGVRKEAITLQQFVSGAEKSSRTTSIARGNSVQGAAPIAHVLDYDALRYLVAYFDLVPSTVKYSQRIY